MTVNCAVCELEIDDREAFASVEGEAETYYICSSRCLESFEQEPERYSAWAFDEQEAAERR